jgi:Ankyrin repeats (3 copies)/Ankyrin repeat
VGALMKKSILLSLIFCKSASCNSLPSASNYKKALQKIQLMHQAAQNNQTAIPEVVNQPNLITVDSVVNVDKAKKEPTDKKAHTALHNATLKQKKENPAPLETEQFQLMGKNGLLSYYSTALTRLATFLGITTFSTFIYTCLLKRKKKTKIESPSSDKRNDQPNTPQKPKPKEPPKHQGLSSSNQPSNQSNKPELQVTAHTSTDTSVPTPIFSAPPITISTPAPLKHSIASTDTNTVVELPLEEEIIPQDALPSKLIELMKSPNKANIKTIENLIQQLNPDTINLRDECDDTLLHLAARSLGQENIVGLLLTKGAEINAKNKKGNTPLHLAASVPNNSATVSLLLEKKADVDTQNLLGRTPLYFAVYCNNTKVVHSLLDHGANIHEPTNDNKTPLTLARQMLRHEMVNVLTRTNTPTVASS